MKTINGITFSGLMKLNQVKQQRTTETEPLLTALSTLGGFRLNAAATKKMNLAVGDYVTFYDNVDAVAECAKKDSPDYNSYVQFCEDNGFEVGSDESIIALHKELDAFYVAKGIQVFSSNGRPLTSKVRMTTADKIAEATEKYADYLEMALAENSGIEEDVRAALESEAVSDEEKIEILAQFVKAETNKFTGAKTANPSGQTGVGSTVTFSNITVWNNLKNDLSEEEATGINRVYDVNVDEPVTIEEHDGFKTVKVLAYEIKFREDRTPVQRGAKADENEE